MTNPEALDPMAWKDAIESLATGPIGVFFMVIISVLTACLLIYVSARFVGRLADLRKAGKE